MSWESTALYYRIINEQVEQDMIASRIGPELRLAVVGTPNFLWRFRYFYRPYAREMRQQKSSAGKSAYAESASFTASCA
ncbi:hypothetical protein [Pantoea sp. App145]|uniref:hypothetical protein n=1 Tax=Pantoea sp. App145 TaxID=3071567 RepID=UPI003A812A2D